MGYKVMRLIDADLALEKIRVLEKEPDYQHEDEDWRSGLYMAESALDEVPTSNIVEQIFEELEHASKYWKGYVSSDVGKTIAELKKKYGVK